MKSQIKFIFLFGLLAFLFIVGDLALLQKYTGLDAGIPKSLAEVVYLASRLFPAVIFSFLLEISDDV